MSHLVRRLANYVSGDLVSRAKCDRLLFTREFFGILPRLRGRTIRVDWLERRSRYITQWAPRYPAPLLLARDLLVLPSGSRSEVCSVKWTHDLADPVLGIQQQSQRRDSSSVLRWGHEKSLKLPQRNSQ